MGVPLDMQSAWTRYWNTGRTESCPEDRAAGRLATLESAWKEFFSGFPDGAKLLDLATGGGDVIRIAIGLARDFHITGVDLADLSVVSGTLQIPGARLIGNTDLSNLPFPDGAFDGVTSQFGIEYADVAAAAHEAVRVLAPGGGGRLLLHHAESPITRAGAERVLAFQSVFIDSSAFRCGRTVFELHRRSAARTAIAVAEAQFRTAVGDLQRRLRNGAAFGTARKVVDFLSGLARIPGIHVPLDALRQMDDVEEQIQAFTLRTQAQVDAALDGKGMSQVARWLAGAGAVVQSPQELRHAEGNVLAWICSFHK